jgi:hypothetical protein
MHHTRSGGTGELAKEAARVGFGAARKFEGYVHFVDPPDYSAK